jgi:hypothetical protein
MSQNERRSNYSLRAGTDPSPRAKVTKIFCLEGCGLQSARKVGKSADYTLDCGHARSQLTSEQIAERNEEHGHA